MTSKSPTAVEEIQSRIETLENQIASALERASSLQSEVGRENDTASRLALLCTQYKRVLQSAADTGSTIIEVRGAIADPTFVAQIERQSRWSR